MHRISITYKNEAGAPFNWDYYMNNHLPLAVGTSMRHSGLHYCDVDKPLNQNSPHTCVCMVHFDTHESVTNFCNFFVKGHPESEKINEDEINYTTIEPNMVVGECEVLSSWGETSTCKYRIKLFFPYIGGTGLSRNDISNNLKKMLDELNAKEAGLIISEVDYCTAGIVPGSEPDYSLILSLCFNEQKGSELFLQRLGEDENLQSIETLVGIKPVIMFSEVQVFDMEKARVYREL